MKLYHGTSSKHLDSILSKGIRPRGRRKGNWESFPSRPDMVYLTNSYAPYFALQSCDKMEKALIVEVEVDETGLYPDEDFIAQVLASQEQRPLEEVHEEVREGLEAYKHHAKDSLEGLGNCSHKGVVPAGNVRRMCLVDFTKRSDLAIMSMDPSISVMNYRFCGSKYRSVISWLFGDRKDFELGIGGNEMWIEMIEKQQPGYRESIGATFLNREGIEVMEAA